MGIDSDNPEHNAMGEGTCDWALEMFKRTLPKAQMMIRQDGYSETDSTSSQVRNFFDLVHIDADHSYHGCLNDMTNFWPFCGRAMLIDDYDAIGAVRDAVAEFIKKTGAMMFNTKSVNGEALLIK